MLKWLGKSVPGAKQKYRHHCTGKRWKIGKIRVAIAQVYPHNYKDADAFYDIEMCLAAKFIISKKQSFDLLHKFFHPCFFTYALTFRMLIFNGVIYCYSQYIFFNQWTFSDKWIITKLIRNVAAVTVTQFTTVLVAKTVSLKNRSITDIGNLWHRKISILYFRKVIQRLDGFSAKLCAKSIAQTVSGNSVATVSTPLALPISL